MEPKYGNKILIAGLVGALVGFGVGALVFKQGSSSKPSSDDISDVSDKDAFATATTEGDSKGKETSDRAGTKDSMAEEKSTTEVIGKEASVTDDKGVMGTQASAVSISDQVAGKKVLADRIVLGEKSWIAIYETAKEKTGWILGARRFSPGVYSKEEIELLRATVPDGAYYAMIHVDDGDDSFDFRKDKPLLDSSSGPIIVRFRTVAE